MLQERRQELSEMWERMRAQPYVHGSTAGNHQQKLDVWCLVLLSGIWHLWGCSAVPRTRTDTVKKGIG